MFFKRKSRTIEKARAGEAHALTVIMESNCTEFRDICSEARNRMRAAASGKDISDSEIEASLSAAILRILNDRPLEFKYRRPVYRLSRTKRLRPGYREEQVPEALQTDPFTGQTGCYWPATYYSQQGQPVSADEAIEVVEELVLAEPARWILTDPESRVETHDYARAIADVVCRLCYDPAPGQGTDHYDDSEAWKATRALCVFRAKPATDSGSNLPPIPGESCHPFRMKPAT